MGKSDMNFKCIVESILQDVAKNKNIEEQFCPDQYVGLISSFQKQAIDFPCRKLVDTRPNHKGCLIMVLESPHINEFKGEPCPANGPTGKLIREHILNVIGLSEYSQHGLIIVNAIQYQCSLGYSTKKYRNKVFISCWESGGQENFVKRLNNVVRDGDTIVNCCTLGGDKTVSLRNKVQDAISYNGVLKRTHPSSWYSVNNRNFTWS
jgi:hypothetical protein